MVQVAIVMGHRNCCADMGWDWLRLLGQCIWAVVLTNGCCAAQLFRHFIWPKKLKSVAGQIVVVVGAGHGLGRRIACKLASRQAHVVCWDIDHDRNLNTVWDITSKNGKATELTCDVTDREAVFRSVAIVRETVGEIDMVVNCVGVYPVKPSLMWTPEEIYALFDTNVMAHYWILQAIVPHMIARKKGHVAVLSSAAAIAPVPGELTYSATKACITGLMHGFIEELKLNGNSNIKCTVVHPYYTAVRDDLPVKFQLRLMPASARHMWRSIFYTKVFASEDLSKYPNIVEHYRIPNVKNAPIQTV